MNKRIMIVLICIAAILSFSSTAIASDNESFTQQTDNFLNTLQDEYGININTVDSIDIININDVPAGITPIVCNTWDELALAIQAFVECEDTAEQSIRSNNIITPFRAAVNNVTKIFDNVYVTLYANASDLGSYPVFYRINSVNSYFNPLVLGTSWEQTDYNINIVDNNRIAEGRVYGIESQYIMTPVGDLVLISNSDSRYVAFAAKDFV